MPKIDYIQILSHSTVNERTVWPPTKSQIGHTHTHKPGVEVIIAIAAEAAKKSPNPIT